MRRQEPTFKTEADLCAAFIAWATKSAPGVQCFAEWSGWDILVVLPEGLQIGIQAKLRLNAEVIGQALPSRWWENDTEGPDFRALLVPEARGPLQTVAYALGLVAFHPSGWDDGFTPPLYGFPRRAGFGDAREADTWVDWNPSKRHELPPVPTDAVAGSPCPITLTSWKLGALAVLADLAVNGTITTKRIRDLGIDPRRWLAAFWLMPAEKRGDWVRGERCPKFDEQHPTAYAVALEKARAASPATDGASA